MLLSVGWVWVFEREWRVGEGPRKRGGREEEEEEEEVERRKRARLLDGSSIDVKVFFTPSHPPPFSTR